ncbi:hypothetical protein ACIRP3_02900 [Streptomyces sp. NPDC101209]|uniref:hypothetical protein n=1 Tax=Streptomyces sp. NPDC101209 TaxID=3366129 RepID=UPI00382B3A2C
MAIARFAHAVPRPRPRRSRWAVMCAVLLGLVVTLLGSSAPVGGHPGVPGVPGGPAPAAGTVSTHARGEVLADDADPDVRTVAVRSHRDATGERPAPPAPTPSASGAAGSCGPAQPRARPAVLLAQEQPAHRHGVRAPPPFSGT